MNIRLREALLPIFLISVVAAFLLLAVVVRSYSGSTIIAGDMSNDPAVSSQWQFGFEIVDSKTETVSDESSIVPASNGQNAVAIGENESAMSADVGILSLLAPIQIVATIIFVTSATIYLYQKLYLASSIRIR